MELHNFTIRIVASILFGLLIGIERQLTGHPAGIRTNVLVCLGSCMFVLFSLLMNAPDNSRIAAQIVTGVGFLCSGIIFKDKINVRGLNTAATIWCTAAIGVLTSSGLLSYALVATLLLLVINIIFRPITNIIEPLINVDDSEKFYKIQITCAAAHDMKVRKVIMNYIETSPLILTYLESNNINDNKVKIIANLNYNGKQRKDKEAEKLISIISNQNNVSAVSWELTEFLNNT